MGRGDPAVVVLIAERDPALRVAYAGVLRHAGHYVFESADGLDALAVATARLPDLIIASPALPGLCGAALCRALKANPETRDIPVIAIVTGREVDMVTDLLRAGAVDVLRAPVWPGVLAGRVRAAVQEVMKHQTREIKVWLNDIRALAREQRAQASELRSRASALLLQIRSRDRGIVLANSVGDVVDANDTALTMTGYSRLELLAKSIWTVMPVAADARQGWLDIVSGANEERTVSLVRKDGSRVLAHAAFMPNVMPNMHATA